jgi:hypothetical protein
MHFLSYGSYRVSVEHPGIHLPAHFVEPYKSTAEQGQASKALKVTPATGWTGTEEGDAATWDGQVLHLRFPFFSARVSRLEANVEAGPGFPCQHNDWTLMVNSVCLAWVLLDGGVVLHAAAVKIAGKCSVFTGKSGAGKSTIALALAPHGTLITNDQAVLLPVEAGWSVQATSPVWGGTRAPMHEIYLIGRSSHPKRRQLPATLSLPGLMNNVILWPARKPVLDWVLERAIQIVQTVPMFELTYGLEHITPELLES